jgi:hypothetical protein
LPFCKTEIFLPHELDRVLAMPLVGQIRWGFGPVAVKSTRMTVSGRGFVVMHNAGAAPKGLTLFRQGIRSWLLLIQIKGEVQDAM